MTKPERIFWRTLREAFPRHNWRKQVPLGPYFADFASHSARLIIEIDGGQHSDASRRDAARTNFMESQGYHVIRFWNNDVMSNASGVLERVAEALAPEGVQS